MSASPTNESASTLAWLRNASGVAANDPNAPLVGMWQRVRDSMLELITRVAMLQDWPSDPWIAKGSRMSGALAGRWQPPEALDEWPTFGARTIVEHRRWPAQATQRGALDEIVSEAIPRHDESEGVGSFEFMEVKSQIEAHRDTAMRQIEHVRAWLGAAMGHLLMSVPLTPPGHRAALIDGTVQRIALARSARFRPELDLGYGEQELDVLYNARMSPQGLVLTETIIGQGEEWREHWSWLATPLDTEHVLSSVRLAARLLHSPTLLAGLERAVTHGATETAPAAVGVLRRWLLTLRAMTWLEHALQLEWRDVRIEDIVCFAFNAVKPQWPRRVVGVSHRSRDVKPALIGTRAWHSARFAIDATYVPSWETNTGMVWGLFATTPVIARVSSPGYDDSVWCRREAEFAHHLVERCDFLSERWVLEVDAGEVAELDELTVGAEDDEDALPSFQLWGSAADFPPACHVWSPEPMDEWQVRMLQAAAAVRMIHAFTGDTDITNRIVEWLASGETLPPPSPTNQPEAWHGYGNVLAAAASSCGAGAPVRIPDGYGEHALAEHIALSNRVPDLSSGVPALGDVLCALEWLHTLWPYLIDQRFGRFLIIDCRNKTRKMWDHDPRLALLRGLAAVRLPVPLWFVQRGDQDVESWPLVGDRPIFTQHVDSQFAWMIETWVTSEWPGMYVEQCDLELCATLRERCQATVRPPPANGG